MPKQVGNPEQHVSAEAVGEKPRKRINWKIWRQAALGMLVLGAMTFLPDQSGNTEFGHLLTSVITNAIRNDNLQSAQEIDASVSSLESEQVKENPFYESYLKIIEDGVAQFRAEHPDEPVTWHKDPQYLSDYDTFRILVTPITADELSLYGAPEIQKYEGKIPLQFFQEIAEDPNDNERVVFATVVKRLPPQLQQVLNTAATNMTALPGTELDQKYHPAVGNVVPTAQVDAYYESMKSDVERLYETQTDKQPLLQSSLFAYALEKNKGDLSAALGDVAGFMKYMVRGDDSGHGIMQLDWLRIHLRDQINKHFSLNDITLENVSGDLHDELVSIWGNQYHIPHLLYLLNSMSPELVRGAAVYEYVTGHHVAGPYKEVVDINFLDDLNELLAYFDSFR